MEFLSSSNVSTKGFRKLGLFGHNLCMTGTVTVVFGPQTRIFSKELLLIETHI